MQHLGKHINKDLGKNYCPLFAKLVFVFPSLIQLKIVPEVNITKSILHSEKTQKFCFFPMQTITEVGESADILDIF